MIAEADFNITKVKQSKLQDISLHNVPFGKYFSDHMLEVDYENGQWKTPSIKPYQALSLDPSLASLHYGQAIFEGVKAYKDANGNAAIFRPYDNFKRFNLSAQRMEMPVVPEEIFIEGMRKLIEIEKDWIPAEPNHSLYIRPFMFSTDEAIGVRPSDKYKFLIILSPTGPYYAKPMRIYAEEKYVRSVKGGYGNAKAAGNYAGSLKASSEANKQGYDQVLWMDAFEHKYVEECGTMNAFFIIGDKIITPGLGEGTILAGVTRDSTIAILKDMGHIVEERKLSIDEIMDAYNADTLKEIFGTGTAATISFIKELKYKDFVMTFEVEKWTIAPEVKVRMDAIKYGEVADTHNWMFKV